MNLKESTEEYLNSTEKKKLWNLIINNDIGELLSILNDNETIERILKQLLSKQKSQLLSNYNFGKIVEGNGALLQNLVNTIISFEINGNYDNLYQIIINKLYKQSKKIVKNIHKNSNKYPINPINGLVLYEATQMHYAFDLLTHYFHIKNDVKNEFYFGMIRTGITFAIMSHHKCLVGHEMLHLAELFEKRNKVKAALKYYKAIVADFGEDLNWFTENENNGADDEERETLDSLKSAYNAIDRIKATNLFNDKYKLIDDILSREYCETLEDEFINER